MDVTKCDIDKSHQKRASSNDGIPLVEDGHVQEGKRDDLVGPNKPPCLFPRLSAEDLLVISQLNTEKGTLPSARSISE